MEDSIIKQMAVIQVGFATGTSFQTIADAGSVLIPSLVFGYFRDYCNSVFLCIIHHSAYNKMAFAGLILNGNMNFSSL